MQVIYNKTVFNIKMCLKYLIIKHFNNKPHVAHVAIWGFFLYLMYMRSHIMPLLTLCFHLSIHANISANLLSYFNVLLSLSLFFLCSGQLNLRLHGEDVIRFRFLAVMKHCGFGVHVVIYITYLGQEVLF